MAKKSNPTAKKKTRSANDKSTYSWDVVNAEKTYLSDTSKSYAAIAKQYGVSRTTVEKYAKKHDWVKRRQKLGEKGIEKFEDKQAELLSQTNEEHLRISKNARNLAYNELLKITKAAGDAPADIKAVNAAIFGMGRAIEIERRVLGLPDIISGNAKDKPVDEEAMTWTDILLSVEEARKKEGTGNAGSGTEKH